jgi:hypothetical protein
MSLSERGLGQRHDAELLQHRHQSAMPQSSRDSQLQRPPRSGGLCLVRAFGVNEHGAPAVC